MKIDMDISIHLFSTNPPEVKHDNNFPLSTPMHPLLLMVSKDPTAPTTEYITALILLASFHQNRATAATVPKAI